MSLQCLNSKMYKYCMSFSLMNLWICIWVYSSSTKLHVILCLYILSISQTDTFFWSCLYLWLLCILLTLAAEWMIDLNKPVGFSSQHMRRLQVCYVLCNHCVSRVCPNKGYFIHSNKKQLKQYNKCVPIITIFFWENKLISSDSTFDFVL